MSNTKATKTTKATKRKTITPASPVSNKKATKQSVPGDSDEVADGEEKQEQKSRSEPGLHSGDSVSFAFSFPLDPQGAVNARWSSPLAVSVSSDGRTIYACDVSNTSVQAYDSEGHFLRQWGGAGAATGKFATNMNLSMCSSPDTREMYVCDCGHNSIQAFDTESGRFLRQYTEMAGPAVPSVMMNLKVRSRRLGVPSQRMASCCISRADVSVAFFVLISPSPLLLNCM